MWYHMKSKTLEREYDEFQQRLEQLRRKNERVPEERIRLAMKVLQRLKQERQSLEGTHRPRTAAGDVRFRIGSRASHCIILFTTGQ